jgi:hypothetical protein
VVVGVAKVAVIEEPDVADIEDLVIGASEELCEVLAGLEKIRQPNHGWQVTLSSLKEVSSQLDLISVLLMCRF